MAHTHGGSNPDGLSRAYAIGIGLNVSFVAIEATAAIVVGSTALLADALHNLSDVVSLVLAWGVSRLARRQATNRHTYGLRSATLLGALAHALLLFGVVGGVAWEAVQRIDAPVTVRAVPVMLVATVGIVINAVSALGFRTASRHDLNVRGAMLHLLADAGVSLVVVVAGAIIWKTSWQWVDPAATLLVAGFILWSTWSLLTESVHLALAGVPRHVDLQAIRDFLLTLPDVVDVHDLHVWALSTTEVALTAHLVIKWRAEPPGFSASLEDQLRARFQIQHTTIQLESAETSRRCGRASAPF